MKSQFIDEDGVKKLESIKKRLFNGDRLTFDERRDLGKMLDSVLRNLIYDTVDSQKLSEEPVKLNFARTPCVNFTAEKAPWFVSELHRYANDPKRFEDLNVGKYTVSIQASDFHRSEPRITLDDPKKYSEFELAFFGENRKWLDLIDLPENVQAILKGYNDGTKGCEVFNYVPVDKIQAVIDLLEKVE